MSRSEKKTTTKKSSTTSSKTRTSKTSNKMDVEEPKESAAETNMQVELKEKALLSQNYDMDDYYSRPKEEVRLISLKNF